MSSRVLCFSFLLCFLYIAHVSSTRLVVPVEVEAGFPAVTVKWGVEQTWKNDFPSEVIDVDLELEVFTSKFTAAIGVRHVVEWVERGLNLAVGYAYSEVSVAAGQAATTYDVAQLSTASSSTKLSNELLYPFFSRLTPTSVDIAKAIVDTILYMVETQGVGWQRVALLVSSDEFGVSSAQAFIDYARNTPLEILTWQNFLPGATDVSVEVGEVIQSDARVIVSYAVNGYDVVLEEAKKQGLLDDDHVFILNPVRVVQRSDEYEENLRGNLGITLQLNTQGERYERLLETWVNADMPDLPSVGPGTRPDVYAEMYYDLGVLTVHTVVEAYRQGLLGDGKLPTAAQWTSIARNITFDGASGLVKFTEDGQRPMPISIVNWRPEGQEWRIVGEWSTEEGVSLYPQEEIIWHDNSTTYPDLLLAPGYKYWSCDAGKEYYDETGHSVKLHRPDAGGFDDIDSHYICDHFIDCPNLSDESGDCSANYTALFIAFGILTGVLLLMTCCLIPFVIVFGFILPRRRVKASSPTFLLIIILSCMLGYISEYSWYGRPHPVGCGFRPWLLGLAVVSLVSALNAKTWRLWRIFNNVYAKERISDVQLIALYVVMVVPAIIILIIWTIVSTPSAQMKEKGSDGYEHYVCTTGGFTGEPGGLVFFFILVGYEALVLFIAAVLVIVTRNVPSFFNESKLIAISIYNLGFLAAVCIPVIIVLDYINPFASWVIRSISVLYAFTATLVLQFAPKVIGVIIIDRGRDASLPSLGRTAAVKSTSSSEQSQPSSVGSLTS